MELTKKEVLNQLRAVSGESGYVFYPTTKSFSLKATKRQSEKFIIFFGRMVAAKGVHSIIREFKHHDWKNEYKLILVGGYSDTFVRHELSQLDSEKNIINIGAYNGSKDLKQKLNNLIEGFKTAIIIMCIIPGIHELTVIFHVRLINLPVRFL